MSERCFIGLGTNLGDRYQQLEQAARLLQALPAASVLRLSPIFTTLALLPPDAPLDWQMPYLNAVAELQWQGSPQALLAAVQAIEQQLGRQPAARWAPRVIDLDVLLFGKQHISAPDLTIPHAGLWRRSFVLDPLLHLAPDLVLDGKMILPQARSLPSHAPLWLGILNLTPDSFSDGGDYSNPAAIKDCLDAYDAAGVQWLDLGAESTRPDATPINAAIEWARLQPVLAQVQQRYAGRLLRPRISVDTYRAEVAAQAIAAGADIINDVSGLSDPAMLAVLQNSNCDYVLMHSLSVPADKNVVLPADCDPVAVIYEWAIEKIAFLTAAGIAPSRILFDPGLGFGKTAAQSLAIVQNIQRFMALPVRLLVGHSRKSFLNLWGETAPKSRDSASIGVSLRLAQAGVDVLRVHAAHQHSAAWVAFQNSAT